MKLNIYRLSFVFVLIVGLSNPNACLAQSKLMYLVAGQSNAVGQGDSTKSIRIATNIALEYSYKSNKLIPLKDPVGENAYGFDKANTGSAWPAFATQLNKLTKRQVIIVPAARSGSACSQKGMLPQYGTWDTSGVLLKNAIKKAKAAVKLTDQPLNGIIWIQGERDANAINDGKLTPTEYRQSLIAVINRLRDSLGNSLPFYIVQTGFYKNHPQEGYKQVQQMQQQVADVMHNVHLVFKASVFYQQNRLKDEIHYNQDALNEMGTTLADSVLTQFKLRAAGLFTNHMVVQQGKPIKVWGWALPGENIVVKLANKQVNIKCNAAGKWDATLPAMAYGGPYTMQIMGAKSKLMYTDVYVGEVWLASGQSNMNFSINRPIRDANAVIDHDNYPLIREFAVPSQVSKYPLQYSVGGSWKQADKKNLPAFSAVSYFFARKLYLKKKVAIGIIHASWGGTVITSWTDGLLLNSSLKTANATAFADSVDWADKQQLSVRVNAIKDSVIKQADNGLTQGVYKPGYNDNSWATQTYPLNVRNMKAQPYSMIWLRKTFEVPQAAAGKPMILNLGKLLESDVTYLNGKEIGRGSQLNETTYQIKGEEVKAGTNVIAIRLLSQWGNGFLGRSIDKPALYSNDRQMYTALDGEWKFNTTIEPAIYSGKGYQNMPSALSNGMINPLVPYGIKGVLWYQGESNADQYKDYGAWQQYLITHLRQRWQQPAMPFLFVQLPNYIPAKSWPLMRQAQASTLKLPNTGMAVTIDVGDPYDVHPDNKQPVGERLANIALNMAYQDKSAPLSPVVTGVIVLGKTAVISFNAGSLPVLKPYNETPFELAGSDEVYYPATAQMKSNVLVLSSDKVEQPVYVRYAWAPNPQAVLFSNKGVPVAPFIQKVK